MSWNNEDVQIITYYSTVKEKKGGLNWIQRVGRVDVYAQSIWLGLYSKYANTQSFESTYNKRNREHRKRYIMRKKNHHKNSKFDILMSG